MKDTIVEYTNYEQNKTEYGLIIGKLTVIDKGRTGLEIGSLLYIIQPLDMRKEVVHLPDKSIKKYFEEVIK